MERETGIEPATNSLEGCDSTTELLPPPKSSGADDRDRTGDLVLTKDALYQLSYIGRAVRASKFCFPKNSLPSDVIPVVVAAVRLWPLRNSWSWRRDLNP